MNHSSLYIRSLPYEISSESLFERIRHLPRPVFLDSNTSAGVDIIAAAPCVTIKTLGKNSYIASSGVTTATTLCPFQVLREQIGRFQPCASLPDFPFTGGAIGYFSYDLARNISHLSTNSKQDPGLPDMDVGIYLWALLRDHIRHKTYFIARPECPSHVRSELLSLFYSDPKNAITPFNLRSAFHANMTAAQYIDSYKKILQYIYAGDCYQINFSQRFEADYEGDEWSAYLKLRDITDAPFSAFLQADEYAILSLSPERFIRVRDGQVETKPIKGTHPRGQNIIQDQQYIQKLQNSAKDQAENLMIVDLMRNDISKSCALGSVKVPEIFTIETYSNVHHLVSTVRGELKPDRDAVDILRDCFPGGSITGAPKRRAMEIIDELEPQRRGVYCGSIGYLDFNGNMDTNIAIRTLVCHKQHIYCWGGGGIVADSDVDNEFQESYVKVSNLLSALQEQPSDLA